MFEVGAVTKALAEHWTGPSLDLNLAVTVALLHDLGNLLKFKRPFLGELEADSEFWERKQDEMRSLYGDSVHQATMMMAKKIGVEPRILNLLDKTGMVGSEEKFTELESKLVQLADLCVSPEGIVGPERRIEEMKSRYGDRVSEYDLKLHAINLNFISHNLSLPLAQILSSIPPEEINSLGSKTL